MATASEDVRAGDRLWTVAELATFLQVPVATLYQWRHHRCGPPVFKVGKHLRYDPSAVRSWLAGQAG